MKDCTPRMIAVCEEKTLQQATAPSGTCPSWEVCLPFGGQLSSNGGCVNYTPGTPPPDGVYSKITIANGCIISADLADIPIYTSQPCSPVPMPCDGTGGGGSGGSLPAPSPTAGNLFTYDAGGRPLVKLSVTAGAGISVVGTGTTDDPIIITNTSGGSGGGGIYIQGGNAAITVSGSGTTGDPYRVSHILRLSGKYGASTFDDYGHLISYDPSTGDTFIRNIIEGDGIKVTIDNATGIATIAQADPQVVLSGDYVLGGYTVSFYRNRLTNIQENIVQTTGTYNMVAVDGGQYAVTLNDLGSVEDIIYTAPPPPDVGQVSTSATKRFTISGETSREMSFTTTRNSAFRITYMDNAIPSDMQMFVDGVSVDGLYFPQQTLVPIVSGSPSTTETVVLKPWRYEVAPVGVYSAGEHDISLVCLNGDLGFTSPGILDITLTVVL